MCRYARTEKQAVEILAKLDEVCLTLLGLNAANVPVDAWEEWTADVIEAAERQRSRSATDKKDELKTAEIASATVGALLTALPEERVSMCSADVTAIRDQAETLRAGALKKAQRLKTLESSLLQKHGLSRAEGGLNLLDALSKELFESVLVMRQEELEAALHQISRLHAQLKKESSSAKERRSLRKRIEKRNAELKVQVLNYNRLVPYGGRSRSNADATALLRGDPEPWRFEGVEEEADLSSRKRKSPALPTLTLKEKLSLLDVYNLKNRLEEESVLLIREMLSYLSYFKGYISDVSSEISGLSELINRLDGLELAAFDISELAGTARYSISDDDASINKDFLAGRVALLCQGRRRAQVLLSKGLENFRGILSAESMRSVLQEVNDPAKTTQSDFDPEVADPELTDEELDSGSEDSD